MLLLRTSSLLAVFLVLGCGAEETEEEEVMRPTRERVCFPGEGATGNPQTIEEAVELINSLPKPVTMPCFLESLDRPMEISASNNPFSAQPAFGPANPRIYVKRGDLVLSVVAKGEGKDLMEFGLGRGDDRSLKGEVHFPVEEDYAPEAPYERIYIDNGSSCSFCHLGEERDEIIDFTQAYLSQAVPIANKNKADFDYLIWQWEQCVPELEQERCDFLDAIFANGEVAHVPY